MGNEMLPLTQELLEQLAALHLQETTGLVKVCYRVTGWFGLEGPFKAHLVQPSAMVKDIFH